MSTLSVREVGMNANEPCAICGVIHRGECKVHHLKRKIARLEKEGEALRAQCVALRIEKIWLEQDVEKLTCPLLQNPQNS